MRMWGCGYPGDVGIQGMCLISLHSRKSLPESLAHQSGPMACEVAWASSSSTEFCLPLSYFDRLTHACGNMPTHTSTHSNTHFRLTAQLPNCPTPICQLLIGPAALTNNQAKKKTGHCLAKTLGSHWNRERRRSSRNGVTARFRFRFRSTSGSRDSDWAREIAHKNTNANSKIQTEMKSKFNRWRSNRECS